MGECLSSGSLWWQGTDASSLQPHVTQGWGPQEHRSPEQSCVTARRRLSSPSIWSYTWGNWSSEGPKDSFKVTELVSGRTWEHTSWGPSSQLLLPLQSHSLWASITAGKEHLWCQSEVQTDIQCLLPCSPSSQIKSDCWRELKLTLGKTNSNS